MEEDREPLPKFDENCPCTGFSFYLHLHVFISFILLFAAFIKVLMVPPFESENFILVGYVVASSFLVFVILAIFKFCLNFLMQKCGICEERRCKIEQLMGLGGVILCAIVPQVLVFYVSNDLYLLAYLTYTFHFVIYILSYTFLSNIKIHPFKYDSIDVAWCYVYIGVSFGYGFPILISVITQFDKNPYIFWTHPVFGVVGFVAIIEFLSVCLLPIKVRSEEELLTIEEQKLQEQLPEKNTENSKPIEDSDVDSFNDAFMHFYSLVAILMLIFGILGSFYTGKMGFGALVGAGSLAIFAVLGWWKTAVEKNENKLSCWTRKLKIGFSGIAISGFAPRIGIYFAGWNFEIIIPMFFISLITACSFYYLFVHGYRKVCNLNHDKYISSIVSMVIFRLLVWFLCIRIAVTYDAGYQRTMIIHTQIGLFFMSLGSLIDLMVVMKGGVYLRNVQKVENNQPDVEQGSDGIATKKNLKISCPACKKAYSGTNNIPRILKECGDTICEKCADFYLEKANHITCPICKIPTVVKGTASTLMKNFAVFDLMENVE